MPKANLKTSEGIIDMLETALNDMYEDKLSIEYAGKRISACKHAIQQHAYQKSATDGKSHTLTLSLCPDHQDASSGSGDETPLYL